MVAYEWVVETLQGEERDIVDLDHFDHLPEALRCAQELRAEGRVVDVALTRNIWNDIDGDLDDRQYAYLENGLLPRAFDGGTKVPLSFLHEAALLAAQEAK